MLPPFALQDKLTSTRVSCVKKQNKTKAFIDSYQRLDLKPWLTAFVMDVCSSHRKSLNSIKESHFIQTNRIKTQFGRRRDKAVTSKHSSHVLIMLLVTDYHSALAHSCFSTRQYRSLNWHLMTNLKRDLDQQIAHAATIF